jgi:hypothetical protein
MSAEQKPEITQAEAFGKVKQMVDGLEAGINKVDSTPGRKNRARRKDLAKTASEIIREHFTIKRTPRSPR